MNTHTPYRTNPCRTCPQEKPSKLRGARPCEACLLIFTVIAELSVRGVAVGCWLWDFGGGRPAEIDGGGG